MFTLLCLDAGLRLGEALGLRWQHVVWDDPRRVSGREAGHRGRRRTVERDRWRSRAGLRAALLDLHRERRQPSPAAHVLEGIDPANFARLEWRRICARAKAGHVRPKDLCDSFASHLLAAGVQLGWISRQLAHRRGHHGAPLGPLVRRRLVPRADGAPGGGSCRPISSLGSPSPTKGS